LRRVSNSEAREILGLNGRQGNFDGILFPYRDPESENVVAFRLRRDEPDLEQKDGKVVEKAKYMATPGQGNHIYFPPNVPVKWLKDTTIPIVIVEGEKKVLALWNIVLRLLRISGERVPFVPIGLSGVWAWRGCVGKQTAPNGKRLGVKGVISDFYKLTLIGRKITVFFDVNVHTNANVQEARRQLGGWLSAQAAHVLFANLKPEPNINGPDDAAAIHGPGYILEILNQAIPLERPEKPRVLEPAEESIITAQPCSGFLRDYMSYAGACLPSVPPDYHLATGLVLEAGILGGKLSTDTGLRPNLAALIVAFQGSGKSLPAVIARSLVDPLEEEEKKVYEATLSRLRKLLQEHDQSDEDPVDRKELEELERQGRPAIVIATQASVEGLLEALSCQQSGIADYDEFSAFLKDCRRDHMRSARENLIKALDGHAIFYRRTRGQTVDVKKPCLSIWGTINVESLRAAASDDDMFGGLFSRLLFCAPDYDFSIPHPRALDRALAQKLLNTLRFWRSIDPISAEFAPGVTERADEYGYVIAPFVRGERISLVEPEDQVASVASVRFASHAQKVAILMAASEQLCSKLKSIMVTMRHMLLAIDLVERFRRQTLRLLRHIENSDPLARDADKVLSKIRRHPGRDRSYYQRIVRGMTSVRFTAAANELERLRRVEWTDEASTGGRKRRVYFPALAR
jgi:hypothetical protein